MKDQNKVRGMRVSPQLAKKLEHYQVTYGWNTGDTMRALIECEERLQKAIERWTITESRQGKEAAYRLLDHDDLCHVGEVDISRENGYAELAIYFMENARLPIPNRYRNEISIKNIL